MDTSIALESRRLHVLMSMCNGDKRDFSLMFARVRRTGFISKTDTRGLTRLLLALERAPRLSSI